MKKGLKVIGIVLFIIIIIFCLAWVWVSGLKEDHHKTIEKMNEVLKAYPDFNTSVDEFSKERTNFYEYKEDLYLETLAVKAEDWNAFMKKYFEAINKIEEKAKDLKENCDINFADVNTKSKCTAFKANYEAAHNYYISDVKLYNDLIKEYDKWNEENGSKYPAVNKAEYSKYKKYIDYDKDGEYFGKEEVVENDEA